VAKSQLSVLAQKVRKRARGEFGKKPPIRTHIDQDHVIVDGDSPEVTRTLWDIVHDNVWCESSYEEGSLTFHVWVAKDAPPPRKQAKAQRAPESDENPQQPLPEEADSGIAYRKVVTSSRGDGVTLAKISLLKIDEEKVVEAHVLGDAHPLKPADFQSHVKALLKCKD